MTMVLGLRSEEMSASLWLSSLPCPLSSSHFGGLIIFDGWSVMESGRARHFDFFRVSLLARIVYRKT